MQFNTNWILIKMLSDLLQQHLSLGTRSYLQKQVNKYWTIIASACNISLHKHERFGQWPLSSGRLVKSALESIFMQPFLNVFWQLSSNNGHWPSEQWSPTCQEPSLLRAHLRYLRIKAHKTSYQYQSVRKERTLSLAFNKSWTKRSVI